MTFGEFLSGIPAALEVLGHWVLGLPVWLVVLGVFVPFGLAFLWLVFGVELLAVLRRVRAEFSRDA